MIRAVQFLVRLRKLKESPEKKERSNDLDSRRVGSEKKGKTSRRSRRYPRGEGRGET